MKNLLSGEVQFSLALLLGMALAAPPDLLAQDYIVSPSAIQNDVAAASAARLRNRDQVRSLLTMPGAQNALQAAHVNYRQVMTAVDHLSDADLAQLAARSQKAQKDFAAGTISDHDLLIILVGFAALILIIVAVH